MVLLLKTWPEQIELLFDFLCIFSAFLSGMRLKSTEYFFFLRRVAGLDLMAGLESSSDDGLEILAETGWDWTSWLLVILRELML